MESYHFKYGQCEQCGQPIEEVGGLQMLNFWQKRDSRRYPYYLYVCDNCFATRNQWCQNIFPDECARCAMPIEDGDHYLGKKLNQEHKDITSCGLAPNEECEIICHECHKLTQDA